MQVELGDYEKAFTSYRHMIEIYRAVDPHYHSLLVARVDLAYAMIRAGQAKQALVDLAAVRVEDPVSEGAFADSVLPMYPNVRRLAIASSTATDASMGTKDLVRVPTREYSNRSWIRCCMRMAPVAANPMKSSASLSSFP